MPIRPFVPQRILAISAAAMMSLAFLGCGGSPDPPPVPGVLTLDSQPLAEAMVTLVPASGEGRGAVAQSDLSGHFKLIPYGGEPLPPGKYKAVVTKMAIPKPGEAPPPFGSSPVPEPYRDAKTTPLEIDLPTEDLKLDLKTTEPAKT